MSFVLHGYVINPSVDADRTDLDPMRLSIRLLYDEAGAKPSTLVSGNCAEDCRDRDRSTGSHNDQDVPRR